MNRARRSDLQESWQRLKKDAPHMPEAEVMISAVEIMACAVFGHSKKRRERADGTPICDRCGSDRVNRVKGGTT